MRKIIVTKLETYPPQDPTGFLVGFIIESNNRQGYIDAIIPFEDASNDEQAVNVAKTILKDEIEIRLTEFESKSSIIGAEVTI